MNRVFQVILVDPVYFAAKTVHSTMSTANAFFILFILVAGIALAIWLFVRGWAPEQLPLWAGLIWGLLAVMIVTPRLLPASIRWGDTVSVVQGLLGLVVLILSVKCLILLIRHGSTLTSSQRWAAYLGFGPLVIGILMVVVLFWVMGAFSTKK